LTCTSVSGGEILLGLQRVDPRAPVGFGPPPKLGGTGDPITYADDASLITIAATCTGKTSGPVVCNARTWYLSMSKLVGRSLAGEPCPQASRGRPGP
jgi:hypothetical protein